MKTAKRLIIGVLLYSWLFGLVTLVNADPPKPNSVLPPTVTPLPPKGSFEAVPIHQATNIVLDPTTASITPLELSEDKKSLTPALPAPPVSEGFGAGSVRVDPVNGITTQVLPPALTSANEIAPAATTILKSEGFEGAFPNDWSRATATGPLWGDVNCFAMEGTWSGWPASEGTGAVDPCVSSSYPNNLNTWLIYGPFSLADARSASLDFFYRISSESCCDKFQWLASGDNVSYNGFQVSGSFTGGPSFRNGFFANGYNFVSFDLANPSLGNLIGDSSVWVAFRFFSDSSITGQGPFIDSISLTKNTDERTFITNENFDVFNFPNLLWENLDSDGLVNGDFRWDDEPCFARSGSWSVWPAGDGANALNPCNGTLYPNNALSWFIHGPFSLGGASEAWVEFYFRNQSELVNDRFWWLASVDGSNFWGFFLSGNYVVGPDGTGYNRIRFNLKNVPGLGDLRGRPEVWLAFFFQSNSSVTNQGPFVDDVSVVIERPPAQPGISQTFLPAIFKSEISTKTYLYVKNQSGGNLLFFRVQGTPQGTIQCNNIPNGATIFCGSFDYGSYTTTAKPAQCNETTKSKFYPIGNYTATVTCVSN